MKALQLVSARASFYFQAFVRFFAGFGFYALNTSRVRT